MQQNEIKPILQKIRMSQGMAKNTPELRTEEAGKIEKLDLWKVPSGKWGKDHLENCPTAWLLTLTLRLQSDSSVTCPFKIPERVGWFWISLLMRGVNRIDENSASSTAQQRAEQPTRKSCLIPNHKPQSPTTSDSLLLDLFSFSPHACLLMAHTISICLDFLHFFPQGRKVLPRYGFMPPALEWIIWMLRAPFLISCLACPRSPTVRRVPSVLPAGQECRLANTVPLLMLGHSSDINSVVTDCELLLKSRPGFPKLPPNVYLLPTEPLAISSLGTVSGVDASAAPLGQLLHLLSFLPGSRRPWQGTPSGTPGAVPHPPAVSPSPPPRLARWA